MPATFTDYLCSGREVTLDLLTDIPATTDQSTWQVTNWEGYRSQIAVPKVVSDQRPSGALVIIESHWTCHSGSWTIKALAITNTGASPFVAQLFNFENVFAGRTFTIACQLILGNWIKK